MKTHDLIQGSPEWLAYRAQHFNASDAPAMMGMSPHKTRNNFIREYATGITADVDARTQQVFDNGHRFEALARPLAEKIIGQYLYPKVGSEGKYSASFDGLTMDESIAFEHKTMNAELYGDGRPWDDGFEIPMHYRIQMEQQLLVSGASKCLFMASRWDDDDQLDVEQHCWYEPDQALRAKIIQGWEQFAEDLAAYVPAPGAAASTVGRTPENLPALRIEVTGAVTASNLDSFKSHAMAVLSNINRKLETDQDFADAEKTVKWCDDVEKRLVAAKQHALSQTESIDALFRALDEVGVQTKAIRLDLEKMVTRRKLEIREAMVLDARNKLQNHVISLNQRIGYGYACIKAPVIDFGAAIKGKRSLDSMQDAVDTELSKAKSACTETAVLVMNNLQTILSCTYAGLFPDAEALVLRDADYVQLIVKSRIEAHEAEMKAREDAAAAKAIQAIEDAKAEPTPVVQAPAQASIELHPAPAAPIFDSVERLKLGDICQRLGFNVTADFLHGLGFSPVATDKAAKLYRESQFTAICAAIVRHVQSVAHGVAA